MFNYISVYNLRQVMGLNCVQLSVWNLKQVVGLHCVLHSV